MWWCKRFALALAFAVSGCGFHLRGEATFPFSTVFVNAPSSPPITTELTRAITSGSTTKVVEAATADRKSVV